MNRTIKAVVVMAAVAATGLVSGCGGGSGGGAGAGVAATSQTSSSALTAPATSDGAALYATNCSGCHGPLATSSKAGVTLTRLQNAIAGDVGGMGSLGALSTADLQAIVSALNPGSVSPGGTPAPAPSTDGALLYSGNCAACHGPLATSTKQGVTMTRLQTAITGNIGGMGFLSTLTSAQLQAIVTALNPTVPTPAPTPSTDGTALYTADCAGCHGPLASSTKAGRTATQIQTAITNNTGGMGYLSTLTSAQVTAIAAALATVTPPTTPTPTPACGSCHAIPPSTGRHARHSSANIGCATCHGTGYSTTTVNAATHNNGAKDLTTTLKWNPTTRSCSPSCHSTKTW